MTVSDSAAVSGYQAAMEAGNTSLAQQYYSQIANADQKFIDATKMNTIMDTCVAVQRFYLTDIKPYIENKQSSWQNKVGQFVFKGNFSTGTQYQVNNFVIHTVSGENKVYICIKTPPVGTLPTNTTYWRVLTIKGVMGESGVGLTFRYNWESGTPYYDEDVVTYNNIVWNCLKDNTNVTPGTDDTVWKIIYTPTQNVYPVQADAPTNISTGDFWFQIVE